VSGGGPCRIHHIGLGSTRGNGSAETRPVHDIFEEEPQIGAYRLVALYTSIAGTTAAVDREILVIGNCVSKSSVGHFPSCSGRRGNKEPGLFSFVLRQKSPPQPRTTGGVRWRGTRKLCLATKMALVIGKCVSSLKEDYVADSPSIPSCESTFPLLSKSFRYIVLFSQISNKAQQQTSSRTTVITSRKHEVHDHLLRSVHNGDHAHE
jgi:hypothetical protein